MPSRAGGGGLAGVMLLALLAASAPASAAAAAPTDLLPPLGAAATPAAAGWGFVGLPDQKPAPTRYEMTQLGGRAALRAEASASYGNWVYRPASPLVLQRLRWAWRVEQPNSRADLSRKDADDAAVRVCVSFELPLDRLGFAERQKLQLARLVSGMPLASATLCYVWAGREPRGATLDSPYTRRVRQIVLRNADDALQTWHDEDRDVVADFLRVFGDEAREPYPATAVLIGADADNTQGRSLAHVADLRATARQGP